MDILAEVSPLVQASNESKALRERQRREEASRRAKSVAFSTLEKKKSVKTGNGKAPASLKPRH